VKTLGSKAHDAPFSVEESAPLKVQAYNRLAPGLLYLDSAKGFFLPKPGSFGAPILE
jgi:hypothetical protein